MRPIVLALSLLPLLPGTSRAEEPNASFLGVGIDQRLGESVSPDLVFQDEAGRPVRLSEYFGKRPVVLVLAYYRCPMLCTLVLNGLVDALRRVSFDAGAQFAVVVVSIDPRETPELAAAKKASYVERYARPHAEGGWHFLTGDEKAIKRLAGTVGFRYAYDPLRDQYAHGSGLVLLTPEGKIARYFYGFQFSSRGPLGGMPESSRAYRQGRRSIQRLTARVSDARPPRSSR